MSEALAMPATMMAEDQALTDQLTIEGYQPESTRSLFNNLAHGRLSKFIATAGSVLTAMAGAEGSLVTAANADVTPSAPATETVQIQSAQVSSSDIATKKVLVLEDVHLKGANLRQCHWTRGGFTNSGKDASGRLHFFHDTKRAELCRDKSSPTGFVKVAGGMTGRDCRNPATEKNIPVEHVKVLLVPKLNMKVELNAHAHAQAIESCGVAEAEASVKQKINLKTLLRGSNVKQTEIFLKLEDKAVAKAKASVTCTSSQIIPPSSQTPTPKNGTEGPGAGTPGTTSTGSTVGGSGTGGQPGNTGEGLPCYDDNSTTNGDQNPNTQGATMYGTPDQFGYCVGLASATQNG